MIPAKLKQGDKIRVIAPSRSLDMIAVSDRKRAIHLLEQLGFTVSFGQHVLERDLFNSSSIESRIADLHDAFRDPQVKAILTVIGGESLHAQSAPRNGVHAEGQHFRPVMAK